MDLGFRGVYYIPPPAFRKSVVVVNIMIILQQKTSNICINEAPAIPENKKTRFLREYFININEY